MFEEVSEARFALLHFVAGPDADHDVQGDDVREVGRHGDQPHSVREIVLLVSKRKNLLLRGGNPHGSERKNKQNSGKSAHLFHCPTVPHGSIKST